MHTKEARWFAFELVNANDQQVGYGCVLAIDSRGATRFAECFLAGTNRVVICDRDSHLGELAHSVAIGES